MTTPRDHLPELSTDEKASLTSGKDFWTLKPIDRVGVPSRCMRPKLSLRFDRSLLLSRRRNITSGPVKSLNV